MKTIGVILCLFAVCSVFSQASLPYSFVNNSTYPDDQVYVAVVGITGGHVWVDATTGQVHPMNVSDNTLAGPVKNGNKGPGGNGMYADCFTKLSDIPNKVIPIPAIAGSRILVSFGSPLYLYFFGYSGASSGYAAPNLANPVDPNQGIRFEMIELTLAPNGLWTNTTRVDSYQYPMGLEVWGANDFYRKTGELLPQKSILELWEAKVPSAFQVCLNKTEGVIMAPSKIPAFQNGGSQADYFKSYVDAIWKKYATEDLIFNSGAAGVWKGRVEGERFVFHNLTNSFGNATAIISRRPNTQEILEGKGVLAENVQNIPGQTLDLVVQAQFCAALNRHAIDLDGASGVTQDWSDSTRYFNAEPYNAYVEFWHRADVSWNQSSYGFCYDDVFEYSSTINAPSPTSVKVTIGGFYTEPASSRITRKMAGLTHAQCRRIGSVMKFGDDARFDLRGARWH